MRDSEEEEAAIFSATYSSSDTHASATIIYNMAERRKNRKRKDDASNTVDGVGNAGDKPSKDEYAVAKWIRDNVPSKKTKFLSHNVEYFTGSRAVGALLDNSPWNKTLFESREQVTDFLDTMLRHKFFHRAKKIVVSEEELSKIRGAKKKSNKELKEEKKSQDKEKEETKESPKDTGNEGKDGKEKKEVEEKQNEERKEPKKKPKVRLEMHIEQYFADCNDAYVWIYEPIPVYYWFFGTLVVLGAIGVCLFPLWPLTIRHGVYYLSVAGAGFFVFILALAVIRIIVFCVLWLLTLGRHHLWLLPNLAEDVGFFGSFWPLYQYEYCGSCSNGDKKSSKKKRHKKDKDSDAEDGGQPQSGREDEKSEKEEAATTAEPATPTERRSNAAESNGEDVSGGEEGSESEKSNTGRDFEMVQHTELEDK